MLAKAPGLRWHPGMSPGPLREERREAAGGLPACPWVADKPQPVTLTAECARPTPPLLLQGPHGMAEEAAPPEGPKKSGRSVSFAEAVAFDTPASDGEHLHPSREGSADQLADGDSGLEGRLPEGIMDTPDSAGSGEAPPAQASPRQRMQRAVRACA